MSYVAYHTTYSMRSGTAYYACGVWGWGRCTRLVCTNVMQISTCTCQINFVICRTIQWCHVHGARVYIKYVAKKMNMNKSKNLKALILLFNSHGPQPGLYIIAIPSHRWFWGATWWHLWCQLMPMLLVCQFVLSSELHTKQKKLSRNQPINYDLMKCSRESL